MLKAYVNGSDITESVEYGSIQTTEQLNNRRNTARFRVVDTAIEEAQIVKILKGSKISAPVSAGASSVTVYETFPTSSFFATGKEIRIGYGTADEEIKTVLSVDHSTKTVVFSSAFRSSHASEEMVGDEIFAGVTLKNPQEAIGKSDISVYQVDAADFSSLMDQKVVVDTYADMYAREIIGRMVYGFTADDSRKELNECESLTGIAYSGTAIAPTLDSTDAVYKISSVNIGATGAGSAVYRFPIASSPSDLSLLNRIRAWIKLPVFPKDSVSSIKARIVDGTGKAFEWDDAVLEGPGWSYDSFDFLRASWIGGTPSKTTATYFEIELVAKKAISIGDFKIDRIFATSGGFTIRNVENGNVLFKDVRAQYKKPSAVVENLAKNNGFAWYVSTGKDLAFFASEKRPSPWSVTDSSTNFGKLKVSADITNLKNRQTVRGWQAPDASLYEQVHVCDGQETSYRLDYPPKDLSIEIDTGSGYVAKTVGVENLVPESSVDFLFNFSEKTVRNGAQSVLPANSKIKISYYQYKDIRVQVRDDLSISTMQALLGGDGIFDGAVISDASIKTFEEWRARAKAEIKAYSNPILTASFETEYDGLQAGQVIRITYVNFAVDSDFVIQKVDARQKGIDGIFTYSVSCGSTMYGLTEFFQYLLKKTETGNIDASELVDVVQTTDDTIVFSDAITGFSRENANFRTMPEVTRRSLDNSLLAYYRLDDGVGKDYSGNGYDFTTYSGSITPETGRSWKPNSALRFKPGAYMLTPTMGLGSNSPVSFSVWIKQDIDAINTGNSLQFLTLGPIYAHIRWSANTVTIRYDNAGAIVVVRGLGAGFRNWVHVVGTFNGSNRMALYLNGEPVSFGIYAKVSIATLFNGFALGSNFDGTIDGDVRVYNRELNGREARHLYDYDGFLPGGHLPKDTEYAIDSYRYFVHPATCTFSGPQITSGNGFFGNAWNYDGNDRITSTDFGGGVLQEATGFGLVYTTNMTGSTRRIFMPTNDRSYQLYTNSTGKVVAAVYDTTWRTVEVTPTVSILNRWAVVGFTYKNGTLKLFIDGQMVGSLSGIGTLTLGGDYYIGNWSTLAQGWIGKIDEIGLTPRASSDAEMLELSNYLLSRTTTDLMADSYADFSVCS